MKRLALPIIATLALATPAMASERDVEYIEGLVSDAAQARYVDEDAAAYDVAIVQLTETAEDPQAGPECRLYADVAVAMFSIVELMDERPDSPVVKWLGNQLAAIAPAARNSCLLAI